MTEVESGRILTPNLPAIRRTSELTVWPPPPAPQARTSFTRTVVRTTIVAVAVVTVIYLMFLRQPSELHTASVAAPGWEELGSCSETISLDGSRSLSLHSDGRVSFARTSAQTEKAARDNAIERGNWKYDETSKRYLITRGEDAAPYSLVSSDEASVCILISGSPTSADLTSSWFAVRSHDEDY
jgi:hypothetical protein